MTRGQIFVKSIEQVLKVQKQKVKKKKKAIIKSIPETDQLVATWLESKVEVIMSCAQTGSRPRTKARLGLAIDLHILGQVGPSSYRLCSSLFNGQLGGWRDE